jgi:hypothetical protein
MSSNSSDWNPERLSLGDAEGDDSGLDVLRRAMKRESQDAIDPARLERIGHAVVLATVAATSPVAVKSSSWLAAKVPNVLLALGMIGGMAIVANVHPKADVPQHVVTAAPEAPAPVPAPVPAEIKTVSPSDLPSAPVVHADSAPKPPPSVAVPVAVAPAQDEIAVLARAHAALRSDPALSLSLCNQLEYKSQFAQEREAVAIEALVYLGRKAEAKTRFRAFEERYPASSHRVHLENLFSTN